jgi:peptidoglycan/LPS O-acetylase OafA/YrhL
MQLASKSMDYRVDTVLRRSTQSAAPRHPRYRSLDVWRGLACLLVIVFHSTFYVATEENDQNLRSASMDRMIAAVTARLWIGVPMFFVISGYCISATADSARHNRAGQRQYFYRRFRRIFPPYWIWLAISIVLVGAADYLIPGLYSDQVHGIFRPWWMREHWVGNVTLTETWLCQVIPSYQGTTLFLGHAWTLCYEEQFYAVVGLCLLFSRRFFFEVMGVISLAVLALCALHPMGKGFFFDGQWIFFAVGVLVYYVINYARGWRAMFLVLTLIAGVIWSLFDPSKLREFHSNTAQATLVAFGFGLCLLALHRHDRQIAENRMVYPIALCGTMCYSLYLVHWPIVKGLSHGLRLLGLTTPAATLLVVVPVCLSASVLVAWVFHQLVERHFLNRPVQQLAQVPPRSSQPQVVDSPANRIAIPGIRQNGTGLFRWNQGVDEGELG